MWEIQLGSVGRGYRRCYALEETNRETHRWGCDTRYYLQVSPDSYLPAISLILTKNNVPSRHPDDLYKNGIQRDSFLPAIKLLKERMIVTDLNSHTGE